MQIKFHVVYFELPCIYRTALTATRYVKSKGDGDLWPLKSRNP